MLPPQILQIATHPEVAQHASILHHNPQHTEVTKPMHAHGLDCPLLTSRAGPDRATSPTPQPPGRSPQIQHVGQQATTITVVPLQPYLGQQATTQGGNTSAQTNVALGQQATPSTANATSTLLVTAGQQGTTQAGSKHKGQLVNTATWPTHAGQTGGLIVSLNNIDYPQPPGRVTTKPAYDAAADCFDMESALSTPENETSPRARQDLKSWPFPSAHLPTRLADIYEAVRISGAPNHESARSLSRPT